MHSTLEILSEAPESAGPDLVSLDDLKLALGITGTTDDAALQAAITMQSRLIAEYCNRRFGLAEAFETFIYDRYENILARQAVTLSLYPVVEVTEVASAGLAGTDHSFDPASGRLWVTNGLCWVDTVAISYSGGYTLPAEAPARLQQAVIQAVNDTRTTGSRDAGIREVQHGDTRIAYFTPSMAAASSGYLSATVIDLIRPYRRLHVA